MNLKNYKLVVFGFFLILFIPAVFGLFSGGVQSDMLGQPSSVPLESNEVYEDYEIDETTGLYEYGPADSFSGSLTITAPWGSPMTVTFTGCSFDVTDLTIMGPVDVTITQGNDLTFENINIQSGASISFAHCTIEAYRLAVLFQSTAYFTDCTVTVPEIEPHPMADPHRFRVDDSSITIEESEFFVYDTLLEIDYSQITIRANSIFTYNVMLDISYDSIAIIEDSTINGGDIVIADNRIGWDCTSSLTIIDSVINAGILDVEVLSEVSIQGEETIVNFMLKSILVSGIVTISNDNIIEGEYGVDYTYKSYNFDENSTINYKNVVIAYPGAYVSIESSYLYGIAAACRVDISNSIIDSIHPSKDLIMLVENSEILGEGGTCQLYGSVSVLGSNIFFGEGTNPPLISFVNSKVQGLIHPFMDLTVVFQHSSYNEADKEFLLDNVLFLKGRDIFIDIKTEVELDIWGWYSESFWVPDGEKITDVHLLLDDVDYGQGLNFIIDPSHLNLDENIFELDAFISGDPIPAFSRDFTIEIVDDDTEPPVIDIQYEGSYTLEDPGQWHVNVSDESGVNILGVEVDGVPATFGNYLGEYSFTNDTIGSDPVNWILYEPENTAIQVHGEKENHSEVVKFWDGAGPVTGGWCHMNKSIPQQTNGTIEFWMYRESGWQGNGTFYTLLGGDTDDAVRGYRQSGGGITLHSDSVTRSLVTPEFSRIPRHHEIVQFKVTDLAGNPVTGLVPGSTIEAEITIRGGDHPIDPRTGAPYPEEHEYIIIFEIFDPTRHSILTWVTSNLTKGVDTTITLQLQVPTYFNYGSGEAAAFLISNWPSQRGITLDWSRFPVDIVEEYPPTLLETIIAPEDWRDDTWHHFRIGFDCTTDTMKVWVNGDYKGEFDFIVPANYIDEICFTTVNGADMGTYYVDAIDFSWADGYYLNRNMDIFDIFDVPATPDIHSITVHATDLDMDRPGDQLSSVATEEVPIGVPELSLVVSPESCDYGDIINFQAQFSLSGNPIFGKAVHFYLDLTDDDVFNQGDLDLGTIQTDQFGVASLDWGCSLNPGSYEIRAEILLPTLELSEGVTFTIIKEDDLQLSLNVYAAPINWLLWRFIFLAKLSEDGIPLANKAVIFYIKGIDQAIGGTITNENGIAVFTLDALYMYLHYSFFAKFLGDEFYVPALSPVVQATLVGSLAELSMMTPDLDLHVYDSEGRHVGINYDTAEVELEIPGAVYSGDSNTTEWIYLPPNVTDYYVVIDARDAEFPTETYQLTITTLNPENETVQLSQNATIEAGEKDAWVPQIDPDTGELEVPKLEATITDKLEQLRDTIMQLNDDVFDKNPTQRKNTLSNKIQALITMIELEDYLSAYDKLLHDIKPKLTGLKTDENEIPWGNGVFKNPWICDVGAQELLQEQCNALLFETKLLF